MKWILLSALMAVPTTSAADPFLVHETAQDMFASMPRLERTDNMFEDCGAGRNTNPNIAYCSTENVIYYVRDWAMSPSASYDMAHVLGHAIQIRHGIADIALRTIRARPDDEAALRSMVTRQVECLAGVLVANAGIGRVDLSDIHRVEPFTGAHWGRNPLNGGPRVSIGLAARAEWFVIGQSSGRVADCAVEEIPSDILVDALR